MCVSSHSSVVLFIFPGNRSQKPTGVLPPPVVIGDQSGLIYNARGLVCVYVRWKSEKPLDVVVMVSAVCVCVCVGGGGWVHVGVCYP